MSSWATPRKNENVVFRVAQPAEVAQYSPLDLRRRQRNLGRLRYFF
jgi:hypothetical protein